MTPYITERNSIGIWQNKQLCHDTFVGLSDYRTVGLSDCRTVGLSDCRIIATAPFKHCIYEVIKLVIISCITYYYTPPIVKRNFKQWWSINSTNINKTDNHTITSHLHFKFFSRNRFLHFCTPFIGGPVQLSLCMLHCWTVNIGEVHIHFHWTFMISNNFDQCC